MYYESYRKSKPWARLVAALIYWAASMIFFVVGFSFSNPIVIFGYDISVPLAVALSITNTIIQISGNDDDRMDAIDRMVWIASYVLGISTNYIGLTMLLNMSDPNLENIIAFCLGVMIEVLPERMLIKFLKELKPKQKNSVVKGNKKHIKYTPKASPVMARIPKKANFEHTPDWAKELMK